MTLSSKKVMNGKKILIPVIVVIALLVGGYLISKNQKNSPQMEQPSTQPLQVVLYNCEPGKSAFDLLREYATDVKFDQSSFGKLVTSIDNNSQGNNKYWLYSIEGKEATISADSYICQKNEEVKWELR